MIVNGELRPGEKVPEEVLCARFGVSRTPIREALKVLAAEGALQILPHRGAIVAGITETQIAEMFPIMAGLERLAGTLACKRASDRDIARVRKLHDAMAERYRAGDEAGYLRYNRLVHEAIFDLASNETLSAFYQQILTRISACRFMLRKDAAHWRKAMEEHEAIIAALEARDAARLADLLDAHVNVTTAEIARAAIMRGANSPAAGKSPMKPARRVPKRKVVDERSV
jgi:DNA-binding GntR family transcriptional regulator